MIQKWVDEIKKSGQLEQELTRMKGILVLQTKSPHPIPEFQSIIVDNANRIFKMLILVKSHGLEGLYNTP